jgi:D-hydroxyproline dehydrogenase subunit beta
MTHPAPDAIVVGAGIVGAAVAYSLAVDGLKVHVLDSSFPGGGTTAGAMGHVVVMDDSAAQLALTTWSRTLLHALGAELPPAVELDGCGTLWLAEDDTQLDTARAKQAYLTRHQVGAELLDEAALAEAEPELRRGLAGALHVPDDVVVYPPALCRWLLERAVERGAKFCGNMHVTRIVEGGVQLTSGRIDAGLVVNAAGAAAPRLSPALDIVPRKGHLAITDRTPGFCRHQLAELGYLKSAHTMGAASVAFNVQPRRTGQVLIGSSRELVDWDARTNRDVLARMLSARRRSCRASTRSACCARGRRSVRRHATSCPTSARAPRFAARGSRRATKDSASRRRSGRGASSPTSWPGVSPPWTPRRSPRRAS